MCTRTFYLCMQFICHILSVHYKQCCHKHLCACLFVPMCKNFYGLYNQKGNCWVIGYLHYQVYCTLPNCFPQMAELICSPTSNIWEHCFSHVHSIIWYCHLFKILLIWSVKMVSHLFLFCIPFIIRLNISLYIFCISLFLYISLYTFVFWFC